MGGDPTPPSIGAVRLEVVDAIATITLDRPDALNALTVAMKRELLAHTTSRRTTSRSLTQPSGPP